MTPEGLRSASVTLDLSQHVSQEHIGIYNANKCSSLKACTVTASCPNENIRVYFSCDTHTTQF